MDYIVYKYDMPGRAPSGAWGGTCPMFGGYGPGGCVGLGMYITGGAWADTGAMTGGRWPGAGPGLTYK